jgi:HSP20 family molecular chaperone IbpA
VHFCEFDEKRIFRRFELPRSIDVDHVTAHLDRGILKVTAAKAQDTSRAAAA